MKFYKMNHVDGVAVPPLAYEIAERLMATHIGLPKLTIVSLVFNSWKVEKPTSAGLLQSKDFVEWMAAEKGYQFYQYGH